MKDFYIDYTVPKNQSYNFPPIKYLLKNNQQARRRKAQQQQQKKLTKQQYDTLSKKTFTLPSRDSGSLISLADLMPPESFGFFQGIPSISVYHGTSRADSLEIRTNLRADFGGGNLGKGFYFTPVFQHAVSYATNRTGEPVVVELKIIEYQDLKVRLLHQSQNMDPFQFYNGPQDILSQTGYAATIALTQEGKIWQFCCKSNSVLKNNFRFVKTFIIP